MDAWLRKLAPLTLGEWRKLFDDLRDQHVRRALDVARLLPPQTAAAVVQAAAHEARGIVLGTDVGYRAMIAVDALPLWLLACLRNSEPTLTVAAIESAMHLDDTARVRQALLDVSLPERPTDAPSGE